MNILVFKNIIRISCQDLIAISSSVSVAIFVDFNISKVLFLIFFLDLIAYKKIRLIILFTMLETELVFLNNAFLSLQLFYLVIANALNSLMCFPWFEYMISLDLNTIIEFSNIAISLPYKKHSNRYKLTFLTLSILKIDFHILNIISTCHLNVYKSWIWSDVNVLIFILVT